MVKTEDFLKLHFGMRRKIKNSGRVNVLYIREAAKKKS